MDTETDSQINRAQYIQCFGRPGGPIRVTLSNIPYEGNITQVHSVLPKIFFITYILHEKGQLLQELGNFSNSNPEVWLPLHLTSYEKSQQHFSI